MHRQRQRPNIVLCGTPGTGKSTIAGQVSEKTGMRHVDVSEWAKSNQCLDGWDDARNCAILDEDKVNNLLAPQLLEGGFLLDYHGCDFYPEELIDLVLVVVVSDTKILYDRLASRGYAPEKIRENVECEIFHTIREEASDAFPEEAVRPVTNDTAEQCSQIVNDICRWIECWSPSS